MTPPRKPRGGKVNFADLVNSVGEKAAVDDAGVDGLYRRNLPLTELAPNPRNRDVGDLDDLASIAERQLQPAIVVTRSAWLRIWPDDEPLIGAANYVVVNGCRRLAAAHRFGRNGLDVIITDSLATSTESTVWAEGVENLDRRDLDLIEEAHWVERYVAELGSAAAAAKKLVKSPAWVSQRRALLKLAPELQQKLRAGELAVRDARRLAQVPMAEQVQAWHDEQAPEDKIHSLWESAAETPEEARRPPAPATPRRDPTPASAVRAIKRLNASPPILAAAILKSLPPDAVEELRALLQHPPKDDQSI